MPGHAYASAPLATHYAPHGMVCSVDHLASSAGVAILRAGGSAADAAIATSAVLAVTTPYMCGMGGDLFALVHDGEVAALDASGRAGQGADADRLVAEGATRMPFEGDIRSVTVPGCVDGWLALHERFGRLALGEVLAPAIGYARDGFPAGKFLAAMVPLVVGVEGADDFRPGGTPPAARTDVSAPRGGRSLEAVVASGRDGFYGGEFGEGLLAVGAGEYGPDDLARPLADWVTPLGRRVWGHDVWTIPPASQGYLTLASALIAEGLDLPADPAEGAWAHLLVESARQAGHDRLARLHEGADPDALLDPDELDRRRAAIDPRRVSPLGHPGADGGTIHLAAVDADHMGVSLIQSNASGFGSRIFEPAPPGSTCTTGASASAIAPGHPARYGPGRRPPHTLAPALITRPDGRVRAVLGSMGGDAQPQIVLQLLARFLQAGQSPGCDGAVAAVRAHAPRPGSGLRHLGRPRCPRRRHRSRHRLRLGSGPRRERGHDVRVVGRASHGMGHAHLIAVTDDGLAGASDWRAGAGAAIGY